MTRSSRESGVPSRRECAPPVHGSWRPKALLSDLAQLGVILAGRAFTTVLPQRFDPALAVALARARNPQGLARRMEGLLPPAGETDGYSTVARDHHRMRMENSLGRVRSLGSRRWTPEVDVEGVDHLRKALGEGRGVVLWRMAFCSAVMVDFALWKHGFRAVHLSRPAHGAGAGSRVGYRVLGPLYSRAETRYLKGRVLIPEDGTLGFMKDLMRELEGNGILSIFGEQKGRQDVEAEFLGGMRGFTTGAPALAHRMGSVLLTQHAVRIGPYRYRVIFDAPISLPRDRPRREFIVGAVREFAERLEGEVRANPGSWTGWG